MKVFINLLNFKMKKIIYYHIYNLFKFSYRGDYEEAVTKSKETLSSHINNLIIIYIIFPIWIIFDGNSFIKEFIGTNKYEIKNFLVIIILILILIGFTKINFIKTYIDKLYTDDLINKSLEMFKDSSNILNFLYRFIFIFLNFFWVMIMFFVELKIFQFIRNL